MAILDEISEQLQAGKAKVVKQLVTQAVEEGMSAKEILEDGLLKGMGIIGAKFKNNEVFVPEVLVAARAIGAHEGYVYVRMEYPLAVKRLNRAEQAAREYGVLGENIFGSGFNFTLHIMEGAGAFV